MFVGSQLLVFGILGYILTDPDYAYHRLVSRVYLDCYVIAYHAGASSLPVLTGSIPAAEVGPAP